MNCIIIEDYEDARKLIEVYVKKTKMLKLLGSYASAIDAINDNHNTFEVDLVLLDIELPGMSGLEYLQTLPRQPAVIILSGQEKYALEAYEYDVSDYILKPIIYPRFYKAVSKVYTRWRKDQNIQQIQNDSFIRKGNMLVRLSLSEIQWIEALENYVIVMTPQEKHSVHFTLKAILQKLPEDQFMQVHRSFIVNLHKIDAIKKSSLEIRVGEEIHQIPIGKIFREELLSRLNLLS